MSAANIACIVLASGLSERFGEEDKLTANLCGKPVLSHVLETASAVGFGEIFCVSKAVDADGFTWVKNENPQDGQGHALRLGLRAARKFGWDKCVVMLGDMPLVSQTYLKKLIEKNTVNQSIISISEFIRMPPAIFNRSAIDIIISQNSPVGARSLFENLNLETLQLDADAAQDVDTPEDLARMTRMMKARKI